jgi:hypothetical protein
VSLLGDTFIIPVLNAPETNPEILTTHSWNTQKETRNRLGKSILFDRGKKKRTTAEQHTNMLEIHDNENKGGLLEHRTRLAGT